MPARNPRPASLSQVATHVIEGWNNVVTGGGYSAPPCPTAAVLRRILELLNYASGIPEEGRYPRFSVLATAAEQPVDGAWRLSNPRPVSVSELRRLLPATDAQKSALLIEWSPDDAIAIVGLVDMGTSWRRARLGLAYHYNAPPNLIIEVERPNRFSIYQGQFRLGTFSDGELDTPRGLDMPLFLHAPTSAGLADLCTRLVRPKREPPKEYHSIEFTALWNCYASIANSIALASHGGTLILLASPEIDAKTTRVKYGLRSSRLSDAFVAFMNARHRSADRYFDQDMGKRVAAGELAKLDREWQRRFEELVECIRFVARLAECDGAVVLNRSLDVLGFGCELTAPLAPGYTVLSKSEDFGSSVKPLDVEQFGMRHRSALKYVSQHPGAVALVVSQDGPISGIWAENGSVLVRSGARLVNANLPWS
jgi:hypothetical protein